MTDLIYMYLCLSYWKWFKGLSDCLLVTRGNYDKVIFIKDYNSLHYKSLFPQIDYSYLHKYALKVFPVVANCAVGMKMHLNQNCLL
jgi:hypothetical protein